MKRKMQTKNKQAILMASFALALMLVAMPLVFAEENSTEEVVVQVADNAGASVSPIDNETASEIAEEMNESVGILDIGMKRMDIFFTLNQEKKAKKELNLARLRLIQARKAAKNNDTAAMEKAFEAHNRILEKVQARINAIDGVSTKEGNQDSAEKLIAMERAIQVHELRVQKLKDLIASDSNLTEEQIARIEEKIDKAEANTAHLKEVQSAKKEKLKTKLMAVSNLSEEEAEEEIEEIEDSQNLSGVEEAIAKVRLDEAKKNLKEVKETILVLKGEGKDVSAVESKAKEFEESVIEAEALINQKRNAEAIGRLNKASEARMELGKKRMNQFREQTREKRAEQAKEKKDSQKIKAED